MTEQEFLTLTREQAVRYLALHGIRLFKLKGSHWAWVLRNSQDRCFGVLDWGSVRNAAELLLTQPTSWWHWDDRGGFAGPRVIFEEISF